MSRALSLTSFLYTYLNTHTITHMTDVHTSMIQHCSPHDVQYRPDMPSHTVCDMLYISKYICSQKRSSRFGAAVLTCCFKRSFLLVSCYVSCAIVVAIVLLPRNEHSINPSMFLSFPGTILQLCLPLVYNFQLLFPKHFLYESKTETSRETSPSTS